MARYAGENPISSLKHFSYCYLVSAKESLAVIVVVVVPQ